MRSKISFYRLPQVSITVLLLFAFTPIKGKALGSLVLNSRTVIEPTISVFIMDSQVTDD